MVRSGSRRILTLWASAVLAASGAAGCGEETLAVQQGEVSGDAGLQEIVEADGGEEESLLADENTDDWVDQVDEDDEAGDDDKAGCPKFCAEDEFTCIGSRLYKCGSGTYGSRECRNMWLLQENCSDTDRYCDSAARSCAACAETCADTPMKCAGNDLLQCVPDARGCASWVVSRTCGADEICDRVTLSCAATGAQCADACSIGERQCNGKEVQECIRSPLGCTVWQTEQVCSGGQVCDTGSARCRAAADEGSQKFTIVLIPDPQNYTRSASEGYSAGEKEKNIYYLRR